MFLPNLLIFITFCLTLHTNIYFFMAKQGYKNRIRVVLADRNMTNRVLADKMGVSEMTVSRWVTNRFQPTMSQFVEISKILNVDIKVLIEVNPLEISGGSEEELAFGLMYPTTTEKKESLLLE